MNRCSICLMPDSLPGSNFNSSNECHWCQTKYPNYAPKGEDELRVLLEASRNRSNSPDCMVGLSGGKDSTYALYRIVKHYGMKAEAFTYVHEGTAGFSLKNAKHTCKILGVKHHIVELPNQAHLKSFISYFQAWLKHPTTVSAGMVCVACKHLHLLGLDLAECRAIPMIIWSTSPLEYSPFLAIKHIGNQKNQFKREGTLKGLTRLVEEMIMSPQFALGIFQHFKTSLKGCLAVFPTCKYLTTKYPTVKPIMFYDYEYWNPITIRKTIEDNLGWTVPSDVLEDWHSDCDFNVFKEYMFQRMLGISYTDAHLSNQIRYGYVTREEARVKLSISKKQFASALPEALERIGKKDLINKMDLTCYEVDIK